MDDDGYPTDATLDVIRNWPPDDPVGLFDYVQPIWRYSDCGYWKQRGDIYRISTGGWSGNEDIISAMQGNYVFWGLNWMNSCRGGHYTFKIYGAVR